MFDNLFDSVAQQSAFRQIHPGTKLLLCLGSLLICLASPSPLVPLVSGIVLSLVLVGPGRVPPSLYGRILLGPVMFTLVSVVVLLFLVGGGDIVWQWNPVSWLNLTITDGALKQGTLVLCRVFGCSVSLFFIALSTPMTDLLNGMKRVGLPAGLVDLMMIIYRYIFIVLDTGVEIRRAQVMRLGYRRPLESVRSFSTLCGMLFITSWSAGEDLVRAMDCRCYDGVFPSLGQAEPVRARSLLPVALYLVLLGGLLAASVQWLGVPA
ncbi:MAG: cobalt ECF transporter T component CbiQ [Methanospirillum sp.]